MRKNWLNNGGLVMRNHPHKPRCSAKCGLASIGGQTAALLPRLSDVVTPKTSPGQTGGLSSGTIGGYLQYRVLNPSLLRLVPDCS